MTREAWKEETRKGETWKEETRKGETWKEVTRKEATPPLSVSSFRLFFFKKSEATCPRFSLFPGPRSKELGMSSHLVPHERHKLVVQNRFIMNQLTGGLCLSTMKGTLEGGRI
jgi:hypothetical protein